MQLLFCLPLINLVTIRWVFSINHNVNIFFTPVFRIICFCAMVLRCSQHMCCGQEVTSSCVLSVPCASCVSAVWLTSCLWWQKDGQGLWALTCTVVYCENNWIMEWAQIFVQWPLPLSFAYPPIFLWMCCCELTVNKVQTKGGEKKRSSYMC